MDNEINTEVEFIESLQNCKNISKVEKINPVIYIVETWVSGSIYFFKFNDKAELYKYLNESYVNKNDIKVYEARQRDLQVKLG